MSHALAYVVTELAPNMSMLEDILLPWHEYESTGYDEYTEEIDMTDEVFASWNSMTTEEKDEYENDIVRYNDDNYNYIARYFSENELRFYNKTNPNAKWDWWVPGGRFSGVLYDKTGANDFDCLIKKDIDINKSMQPFALIYEGEWHEVGELGWWGCIHDEKSKDDWGEEFKTIWESIPDNYYITVVDYHI
jgi:hypothetical protein